MKQLLHNLWNFEFKKTHPSYEKGVFWLVFIIGFGYVVGELFFGMNPAAIGFTWSDFRLALNSPTSTDSAYGQFKMLFPYIWIALVLGCFLIRITIIFSSYFLSKKKIGEGAFATYFVTYFSSFLIAAFSGVLLLFFIYFISVSFGFRVDSGVNVLATLMANVTTFTNTHFDSVLHVGNYWLALLLTVFLSALPGYFIHWLSHKSRFFWLVTHRAHHTPEFLHPLAAPPAFAFDFFLVVPNTLVAIVVSKLIYTEPLVMEMVLWNTFGYFFEIFNHSIVHYDFAFNNFWVRNFCRIVGGDGVYHLVHHSAFEQDQNVNFGGSPFMLWDRVFGTYRKPYETAPPLGLTNNPTLRLNPFRIIFSGIAQLLFELKTNRSWRTRFLVIFGGIYYKPPVSKDFLIIEK